VFQLPILLLVSTVAAGSPVAKAPVATGRCVEARTASVFAGACHYGSEATTGGREALIAWRFDAGSHLGIDLAGVRAAAAIAGERNLAERDGTRRSILFVSERATPAQRRAVLDLLRSACAPVLGEILEERSAPLEIEFEGDRYRVACGEKIELAGALLADRACCKMPYAVWYRPLTPIAGAVVGENRVFRSGERALGEIWNRPDENAAFSGTFELR
jgi:hypothetical protein